MVQVDSAWTQAAMNEMTVDEIGGHDEVSGDLTLNAHVDVLRRPAWHIDWIDSTLGLLDDLDGGYGRIRICQVLNQAGADCRQNRHEVRTGEQRRRAGEV